MRFGCLYMVVMFILICIVAFPPSALILVPSFYYLVTMNNAGVSRNEEGQRCCPKCKSRRYQARMSRQRPLFPMLGWQFKFAGARIEYNCLDCGKQWKESDDDP
jgi:hypothetical protein